MTNPVDPYVAVPKTQMVSSKTPALNEDGTLSPTLFRMLENLTKQEGLLVLIGDSQFPGDNDSKYIVKATLPIPGSAESSIGGIPQYLYFVERKNKGASK